MDKELRRQRVRYYGRTYRQRLKKQAKQLLGSKCYFCEETENLEAAHITPTEVSGQGRGLTARSRDIIKHPECYRAMCKRCHKRFDRLITLSKLQEVPF